MIFQVNKLTFRYPEKPDKVALSGIDLKIPSNQTVAILGPSGSGKTTLLHQLGLLWEGTVAPGTIQYFYREDKEDIPVDYGLLERESANLLRLHHFGFVLQSSYMLPYFTCRYNLTLPLRLQGWDEQKINTRVDHLLGWLKTFEEKRLARSDGQPNDRDEEELDGILDDLGSEASTGQRQRIAVLRALAHDPYVVFADEPVSNLDPRNTDLMIQLLRAWRTGELFQKQDQPEGGSSSSPPTPGNRHPRTLFLVCHHLETAREKAEADWFIILDSKHQLVQSIPASDWAKHEREIHQVLGIRASASAEKNHVTSTSPQPVIS